MSLIETYQSRKQLIADNLNTVGVSDASVNDGLTTLANKILNASARITTILTIEVPLNLVYGDDFIITGVLSDTDGNLLVNETIKLLVGSTVVDTGVTGNNGEVSFTRCPVHMGTHTFKLVYDGNSTGGHTYAACESSSVTRDIQKETSLLDLTSPQNNLSVYTDGYFTVSGILFTDDGERLSDKTITVSDGSSNIGTFVTDSNGVFSGSLNIPTAGTYSLTFAFAGDTFYTATGGNRNIIVNDVELDIDLTAGNQILSYADEQETPGSQYATLTATLTGANIANKAIEFYVDDVLVDTVNTDNNGKASYTYHSQGVGDVTITASKEVSGSVVSKTYSIQDCISAYADTKIDKWTTNGATGLTINSNGLTLANSNWANVTLTQQLQQGISIEYKITALGGSNTDKLYYNFGTVGGHFRTNSLMWDSTEISQSMVNTVIRFEIENNTIKIYLNDVLKVTDSFTATAFNIAFSNGSNRSGTIKDLLIKPL